MKLTVQVTTDRTLKPGDKVLLETQEDKSLQIIGKETLTLKKTKIAFNTTSQKGKAAVEIEIQGVTQEKKEVTVVLS